MLGSDRCTLRVGPSDKAFATAPLLAGSAAHPGHAAPEGVSVKAILAHVNYDALAKLRAVICARDHAQVPVPRRILHLGFIEPVLKSEIG